MARVPRDGSRNAACSAGRFARAHAGTAAARPDRYVDVVVEVGGCLTRMVPLYQDGL